MVTRSAVVVRSGDLVAAPMGGELAMMDMESGTYFVLDEIAAAIWQRIAAPVSVEALCAALIGEYSVGAEQCESDVLTFLEKLEAKGLLRVVG